MALPRIELPVPFAHVTPPGRLNYHPPLTKRVLYH
uniref:Uncharacterized protein n=1 Tax=Peronospora matthiolae TaxID=2874970 RepID=A0AAV1VNU6_9STRA